MLGRYVSIHWQVILLHIKKIKSVATRAFNVEKSQRTASAESSIFFDLKPPKLHAATPVVNSLLVDSAWRDC
jgi:hypothetical protein